jgi:hypothetical protein
VHETVLAVISDVSYDVDDDDANAKTSKVVSQQSRQAMLILLGAALKCNGLSYEQGYMYFCASSSSSGSSSTNARDTFGVLSSTLLPSGLCALVTSLFGEGGRVSSTPSHLSSSSQQPPQPPSSPLFSQCRMYLPNPDKFSRLLLRAAFDPQVRTFLQFRV